MNHSRIARGAVAAVAAFSIAACGSSASDSDSASGPTISVEDNNGTHKVPSPPTSVVATDNRTFETLSDWGVELSAAAVALMPSTIDYTKNKDIIDLGNHREPDLEAVVQAKPDLIINGQRFADYADDFAKLAPKATLLNLDPREGQPFDQELKRQTSVLGQVFDKQAEATELNDALDASIKRVKDAYDPKQKVLAVTTSGGQIGYLAPTVGRTLGPVYDILGLTPALKVDGASDDHEGAEISVEAIAAADPDWILVMDRDAAVAASEPGYKPAADILEGSQALKRVPAIKNKKLVYMPSDTYTNEGIQTYTEYFNALADAFEADK
jgi:iron complex transport system substrate-binding protein